LWTDTDVSEKYALAIFRVEQENSSLHKQVTREMVMAASKIRGM
jgi:hypothetical protein